MSPFSENNAPQAGMPLDYAWRVMMMAGLGFYQLRLDDNDGPALDFNDEFPLLLGRGSRDLPRNFEEFIKTCVHPDDRATSRELLQHPTERTFPFNHEIRLFHVKDNQWRWYRVFGDIGEYDERGLPVLIFGCILDIDNERATKLQLQEQAAILQRERDHIDAIIEAAELVAWDWDLATDIMHLSGHMPRQGTEPESWVESGPVRRIWQPYLSEENIQRFIDAKNRYVDGQSKQYEVEFKRDLPDGDVSWWQDRGRATEWDANGKPTRLMGVTIDITAQKKAVLALRESQDRQAELEESADLGTWEWNVVTDAVASNAVYKRRFGYTDETWPAPTFTRWLETMCHPDDMQKGREQLRDMKEDRVDSRPRIIRMRHRDGHYLWVRAVTQVYKRDAAGRPLIVGGVQTDVTENKDLESGHDEALAIIRRQKEELEQELTGRNKMLDDVRQYIESMVGPAAGNVNDHENAARREMDVLRERIVRAGGSGDGHDIRRYVMLALRLLTDERRELRATEEQYGNERRLWGDLLDTCPVGLSISSNNVVRYASPRARKVFGIQPGNHYSNHLRQEELDDIRRTLNATPTRNVAWRSVKLKMPNGEWHDSLLNVIDTVYDGQPAAAAWIVDVSQLDRADRRIRLMLDAVPLAVTFWDQQTVPIDCNGYAVELFGMPSKEAYLERFYELSPERQPNGGLSRVMSRDNIERTLREGQIDFTWMHSRPDGTTFPCEVTLRAISFEGHRVVLGWCRDMSEIFARRAQVTQAREQMRSLLDAIPVGVALFDADGRLVDGNLAAAELFGLRDREELVNRFGELSPPRQPDGRPSREAMREWLAKARAEGRAELLWTHQRPDGTPLQVRVTLRAVHGGGKPEVAAFLEPPTAPPSDLF